MNLIIDKRFFGQAFFSKILRSEQLIAKQLVAWFQEFCKTKLLIAKRLAISILRPKKVGCETKMMKKIGKKR